ncbi:hypothetical protein [Gordonia soli]|uniref:hypothetical protein n=1 Tax=Gordonia soli TaxID=320799 RepID=UPI00034A2106|nr:hypothetical protein [Gordonia soli]
MSADPTAAASSTALPVASIETSVIEHARAATVIAVLLCISSAVTFIALFA